MTDLDIAAWHKQNVGVGGSTNAAAGLLFPNDSLSWALEYLSGWIPEGHTTKEYPSVCVLYAMAYLRVRMVDHPLLEDRYEDYISQAPWMLETICRAHRAWSDDLADLLTMADIGDLIRIGGLDKIHKLHLVCVSGYDAETGALLCTDGGQRNGTYIEEVQRLMVIDPNGKPWLVKPEAPYRLGAPNGRPITARVFGSKLP